MERLEAALNLIKSGYDTGTTAQIVSSVIFLVMGVWGSAFAYGLIDGKLIGKYRWNPEFKGHMRWLCPLLVLLSIGSLICLFT